MAHRFLLKKLEFKKDSVKATVMEVKIQEGMGTTLDVILSNGVLRAGDNIIISGMEGPIKTTIKSMMTPHSMKEMRVTKADFDFYKEINAVIGVKIFALNTEKALAGSPLFVYEDDEEAEYYSKEALKDFNSIVQSYVTKSEIGIYVQSSTLGSLEAILVFLEEKKVPIFHVGLGTLQKRDVKMLETFYENQGKDMLEYKVILAFDVKVDKEAELYAKENKITIFTAEIIYNLFDEYVAWKEKCIEERKSANIKTATFPCELKVCL